MNGSIIANEPIFNSYQEALLFSFNYADQQFSKSLMSRILSFNGNGRGLSGFNGAGEAGIISASVRKLSKIHQDILCVRYTKVKASCKCCGHETITQQVKEALNRIEAYVRGVANSDGRPSNLERYNQLKKSEASNKNELMDNIIQFSKKEDENENEKIKGSASLSNLLLVRAIIYEYFGLNDYGTIKKMASKYDVHRVTASKYATVIKKALRIAEREAENNICLFLEESGKINHME